MALRIYTKEEFELELRSLWGLEPTDSTTQKTRFWKTPEGKFLTVPEFEDGDPYPHFLFGEIVNQINDLKQN